MAGLLDAYDTVIAADGEPVAVDATADALDDGDVAAAMWSELGRRGATLDDLTRFAGVLPVTDATSIGAVWLRARLLDGSGDTTAAVDMLEAAVDGRCGHRPALVDLAGFRADRGDAVGALRLLTQAGIGPPDADDDDDESRSDAELLWDEVEGFATHRPRPTARRNDPCPCGSGRKYKACHLGRETHSLDDRAGWLFLKAQRFLRQPPPRRRGQPGGADGRRDRSAQRCSRTSWRHRSSLMSCCTKTGSSPSSSPPVTRCFPTTRRCSPPSGRWSTVASSRSSTSTPAASSCATSPAASGSASSTPIPATGPGPACCSSAGHSPSATPTAPSADSCTSPTATPTRCWPPSTAATVTPSPTPWPPSWPRPGSPTPTATTSSHHTITWRVPDPSLVGDALVAAGLQADNDGWTLVRNSTNQDNTVIAGVDLDGDELTVEVNSAERAAELQALVAAALPDAELVDVDARPFEVPADGPVRPPTGGVDVNDPAIRAVLADHIAGMERRWLDESIPALGGRTPREAADDPIGREELTRLLASLPGAGRRRHRRHESRPAPGCARAVSQAGAIVAHGRPSRSSVTS